MLLPCSFITVGRITKPHGIRGDVTAEYYAESLKYLDDNQIFIKTDRSDAKKVEIVSWKERGNLIVLKLKEVNSRTEAEFLRNYDLVIDESLLNYETENGLTKDLSEDSDFDDQNPYLQHLIGINVVIAQDQPETTKVSSSQTKTEILCNNSELVVGVIEDIIFPADQELWVIKNCEQKEILFPAVSVFVERYDLANKKVYINPPKGLLDIYLDNPEPKPKKEKREQNKNKTSAQK